MNVVHIYQFSFWLLKYVNNRARGNRKRFMYLGPKLEKWVYILLMRAVFQI